MFLKIEVQTAHLRRACTKLNIAGVSILLASIDEIYLLRNCRIRMILASLKSSVQMIIVSFILILKKSRCFLKYNKNILCRIIMQHLYTEYVFRWSVSALRNIGHYAQKLMILHFFSYTGRQRIPLNLQGIPILN